MIELKGKPVADAHRIVLEEKLQVLARNNISIGMAILLVGDDKASHMYAKFMKKTAEGIGFTATIFELPDTATQTEVETLMCTLSEDDTIHGILPMMPMPKHIDVDKVISQLNPKKDLDGLTIENIGLVSSGRDGFVPCTPAACIAILDHYKISVEGKRAVVVGRSNVVGRPVSGMLLDRHATVTICHSRTSGLRQILLAADIVIAAIGKAHFIKPHMLKEGAVVLDVGINELDGKTVGDVDYEGLVPVVSAMTPVPGGVGSVTTTMMLESLYKAYMAQQHA